MSYTQLPTRTSTDTNSAADVNQLQANIEALKGGTGATAPTTDIESLSSDKADDSEVVHNTGNESIDGVKTFTSFPVTPSSAPTTNYQTANKKYVDDNSGQITYSKYETTGSYIITDSDGYSHIFVSPGTSGSATITLPTLADNQQRRITIYNADVASSTVTVSGEGVEDINGLGSIDITGYGNGITVFGMSKEWKAQPFFNPRGVLGEDGSTRALYIGGGQYQFTTDNELDYTASISSTTTITVSELPNNTVEIYGIFQIKNPTVSTRLYLKRASGDTILYTYNSNSVGSSATYTWFYSDFCIPTSSNNFYVYQLEDECVFFSILGYKVKL
jgi:hypothetical protein